jgi:hypothetical protein
MKMARLSALSAGRFYHRHATLVLIAARGWVHRRVMARSEGLGLFWRSRLHFPLLHFLTDATTFLSFTITLPFCTALPFLLTKCRWINWEYDEGALTHCCHLLKCFLRHFRCACAEVIGTICIVSRARIWIFMSILLRIIKAMLFISCLIRILDNPWNTVLMTSGYNFY